MKRMNWSCGYETAVSSTTAVGLPLPCYTSTASGGALAAVCLWALQGLAFVDALRAQGFTVTTDGLCGGLLLKEDWNATKPFRQLQNPASRQRGSQGLSGAGRGEAA